MIDVAYYFLRNSLVALLEALFARGRCVCYTSVVLHQRTHLRTHSLQVVHMCVYVYMCVCMHMHMDAYVRL